MSSVVLVYSNIYVSSVQISYFVLYLDIYDFIRWGKTDDVISYRYDVFLSYSVGSEQDFVTQYLFPSLELEPYKLKVCYHQRDFTPGEFINDAIADAILNSRKVLVVLSPEYLNSGYCIYELQQAMYKEYATGRNVVAVIKLGSVDDIPLCLRNKSFIDFDNSDERANFQKKLLDFFNKQETGLFASCLRAKRL